MDMSEQPTEGSAGWRELLEAQRRQLATETGVPVGRIVVTCAVWDQRNLFRLRMTLYGYWLTFGDLPKALRIDPVILADLRDHASRFPLIAAVFALTPVVARRNVSLEARGVEGEIFDYGDFYSELGEPEIPAGFVERLYAVRPRDPIA